MRITPWTASLASPVSPQGEHGSSSGSTPKPPAPKNSYCPQFSPIFPIFPNFPTSAHTASAGVDVTHCPRIQTPLNLTAILFCPLRPFRPFPSSPQTPYPLLSCRARQRLVQCVGSEIGPIRPAHDPQLVNTHLLEQARVLERLKHRTKQALGKIHLALHGPQQRTPLLIR